MNMCKRSKNYFRDATFCMTGMAFEMGIISDVAISQSDCIIPICIIKNIKNIYRKKLLLLLVS